MTRAENRRVQQIAQQAASMNTPPASTPAWRADVGFARAHSMRIWDAVAAIRAGKSKPADHRIPGIGGPDDKDHTIPPGRVKDPPDDIDEVEDIADDEETEPCDRCGGSGMVDGDVCDKCGGTGRVPSDDDQDQDDDRDDDRHADDSDDSDDDSDE